MMYLRLSLNFKESEWVTVRSCWKVWLHLLTVLLQVCVAMQDLLFLWLSVRKPLWVGQNLSNNVILAEIIAEEQRSILR